MGLSTDELIDAMGICGASSIALGASRLGNVRMWKGVAHPYVTHNAIQACQMAQAGITGPQEIFEGEGGFFQAVSKQEIEIDHLGGVDDAPYRILNAHIKPFPCGYYMQTAVLGARDLVAENDIEPSEIEEVSVETFHRAAQVLASPEKWSTNLTRETADHSLPYTVAVAILEGDVTPRHYAPEYLRNETVHELMQLVSVEENQSLNDFIAKNPTAIPMVVEITTGEDTYRTRLDYPIGHAQNPMEMAEVEDKMREMAQPLLTEAQMASLVEFCSDLDQRDSVEELVSNLVI
jgi:2-methylcitrate dehydratase